MTERVLVTGAGGPAGVNVIRTLRRSGHFVVGADADPRAAGALLADAGAVVPMATDRRFVPAILELVRGHDVTVLLSTVAEELVELSAASARLTRAGVGSWLPSVDAVEACCDKWLFARRLTEHAVPAPDTVLGSDVGEGPLPPGPWIVKPRRGRGSRDVHRACEPAELHYLLARVPEPIVQTLVEGDEFTADVVCDDDNTVVGGAARWRLETKAGISTKATTFDLAVVTPAVQAAVAAVGLVGIANVQGFVRPDGAVSIIEVNPRFSGGLALSQHAGADLVGQYLRRSRGLPLQADRLAARSGITMVRHFEEVYLPCA